MALILRSRPRTRMSAYRGTYVLAAFALTTVGAVAAGELARVWRRGSAPLPTETDDLFGAVEEAARETAEVVAAGYRDVSARENALLNLLLAFTGTFATVRFSTFVIRRRGETGPFRNVRFGKRHIHHFVPGIGMALLAGGVSVVSEDEKLDKWLAIPFGAGAALTLDESALLLELDDVYWTERGVVSVQITLAAIGMLSSLALALRLLQRGEQVVLEGAPASP
jgi:hypothetical protein